VDERIYIFLPVHNRKNITSRFIGCLRTQTFQNYHLVLIDDGSTDGTEEMVRDAIRNLTVIKGRGDWWWAGSLQQGINWLKSQHLSATDLILIINDDTEFEPNFLQTALDVLADRKETLLLAQSYSRQNGLLIDAGIHADLKRLRFKTPSGAEQLNCLSTRGLFFRVSDLDQIGGFHPRLLPHYLSDYEFTIRAHRKGMLLMTDPSLKVWLDERATGYHEISDESYNDFIMNYFSKKSSGNPLAWAAFVLLACPWPWKFINIFRVSAAALSILFSAALRKDV
jgi:GT2 family glycosyltransferase